TVGEEDSTFPVGKGHFFTTCSGLIRGDESMIGLIVMKRTTNRRRKRIPIPIPICNDVFLSKRRFLGDGDARLLGGSRGEEWTVSEKSRMESAVFVLCTARSLRYDSTFMKVRTSASGSGSETC